MVVVTDRREKENVKKVHKLPQPNSKGTKNIPWYEYDARVTTRSV